MRINRFAPVAAIRVKDAALRRGGCRHKLQMIMMVICIVFMMVLAQSPAAASQLCISLALSSQCGLLTCLVQTRASRALRLQVDHELRSDRRRSLLKNKKSDRRRSL